MADEKKNLVIIIEDDFDVSNMFNMAAGLVRDYEIEIIEDGAEAVLRLKGKRLPSVVVLDLHLPNLEGDEFLHAARRDERWKDVPIYIVTGDVRAAERQIRHPEGATGVFIKGTMSIDEIEVILNRHRK